MKKIKLEGIKKSRNPIEQCSRRDFLKVPCITLAIIALSMSAFFCSSDESSTGASPVSGGNCLSNGSTAVIGGNHGHSMTVSIADIAAGSIKSYDIQGNASHTHTVNLSAADFNNLKTNQGIEVISSTNSEHSHSIVINCQ